MFFKKFRDKLSGKIEKSIRQKKIEDEFNNGNIVLPTGLTDYENYEDFKSKTSQLKNIQNQLTLIEKNGK